MKCAVCGIELPERTVICRVCGFDISACVELYPTFVRNVGVQKTLTQRKREAQVRLLAQQAEKLQTGSTDASTASSSKEHPGPLPKGSLANKTTENTVKRRFDGEQIPPPAHGSYDPKDRFANVAEMRSALEALKNVDASPAAAVPMGAAAAVAGAVAAGAAADEMTTGTVGRQKGYVPEEGTVGVFGAGAVQPAEDAAVGVFHNGNSANQQIQRQTRQVSSQQGSENYGVQRPGQNGAMNATSVVTTSHDQKEEKKKKRGIAAWITIAAGLVVVIGGVLFLTLGKKDNGNQRDAGSALNNHSQGETKEAVAQENVSAPETSPNQTSELNHDPPVDTEEPSRETEADNGEASPSDQAESLSLNHDDITFFAPGENMQLNVVTAPAGKQITWYSENESVATVDQSGHVWASGSGTTLICAVSGDLSASCLVRCNFAQVSDNEGAEIQILSSFVLSDGYDDSEFATSTAISYDAQYNPISYRESASDGVTEYALGYNEGSHMGYSSTYESSLEGSGEQRTEWTFNSEGLVTKEEIFYSSGERTVTYFSYDSAGRLLTAQWIGVFESQIKEYRYNAAGELIQLDITDQDMDGSAVSHSESVENTYTEGRLYSRQFYEDGSLKAEELYDENGNLTRYRDIIAEDWVRVYSYRYESVYIESGQSFPSWYCANCLVRHE